MRILFMGTPDFAVASLRRLVADGHEVCGVFTQPDKPKNRGHKLVPTPVKEFALTENIPVYQPLKMRDGTALELVASPWHREFLTCGGRPTGGAVMRCSGGGISGGARITALSSDASTSSLCCPSTGGGPPSTWGLILNGEETYRRLLIMYMATGAGRRGLWVPGRYW